MSEVAAPPDSHVSLVSPRRFAAGLRFMAAAGLSATLTAGCSDGPAGPGGGEPPLRGDVAAGRAAFLESCSGCHNSRDGFDLAFFRYPDSTIVRRAVKHVSEPTARDIVAHIRSLGPGQATRNERVFQPRGRLLSSDIHFAVELFGADEWPVDMTPGALAAIDPREVAVAIPFPVWSSEETDTDWLADRPIPDALLDFDPGSPVLRSPRSYLDLYYAEPSVDLAERAVQALRDAVANRNNPAAPCSHGQRGIVSGPDPRACFDALRWIASFAAQQVLREGDRAEIPQAFHQAWWDVGASLRNVDDQAAPIGQSLANRAAWTYLGWTFGPADERRAIAYSTGEVAALGLVRHATFNSLRAMVERPYASMVAYADLQEAADHAPPEWKYRVVKFAYEYLLSRLEAGEWPRDLLYPKGNVQAAYALVERYVTESERTELEILRDRVLTLLLSPLGG